MTRAQRPLARVVARTEAGKLAARGERCAATYTPIRSTCPDTCALRTAGLERAAPEGEARCYGETGPASWAVKRLELASELAHAHAEAAGIVRLDPAIPCRIHIVGDARTEPAAAILGGAVEAWGGRAWTFTHAHAQVARRYWGPVAVRASIDLFEQAAAAHAQGYGALAHTVAPAVFDALPPAFTLAGDRWVKCPEQTGRAPSCVSCGLCLRERVSIVFRAHGIDRDGAMIPPPPELEP